MELHAKYTFLPRAAYLGKQLQERFKLRDGVGPGLASDSRNCGKSNLKNIRPVW